MSAASSKKVIVIAGPTAVGKTSVAIAIATHLGTEIISADSRQCYKELKIGVARPSDEELQQIKHHFIASHSMHDKVTAAVFEGYAMEKTAGIFNNKDVAVMVGGTGLYIKAFCEGMDDIPEVPENIRSEIISNYKERGLQWLQQQVQEKDPEFFCTGETQNPQRMMRALEVVSFTGRSITEFRRKEKANRNFEVIKIALELPKEQLHRQIDYRVDQMISDGLVDEVASLHPQQHLNALQTVGYKEIFSYLNGEISLPEAIALIKKNTKQYAKRQMTWFRKDKEFNWLSPDVKIVKSFLDQKL